MWLPQSECASTGHAQSPGASDSSFLDWLLADADGVESAYSPPRLLSPRAGCDAHWGNSREHTALPSQGQEPPLVSSASVSSTQPAAKMRELQKEASRLWDERVNKISPPSNTSATAAPPKSNSWQRRKREMKQLRDEVARLEDELKARQAYASGYSAGHYSEEQRQRIQRRRQYLSLAWKLAAEREEQLKRASMAENTRLKGLVERHAELSRTLQPALFQQETNAVSLPQQARLQSTVERVNLFNTLEQKLSARLPLVEEIVKHTCAPLKRPVDMVEMNVNGGETGQPVGNIQRAKTFPFCVKSVVEIVWRCAENGFREVSSSPGAAFRLSEDSLGMDAVVGVPRQGVEGAILNFHVRGVLKRWVTDKRVLIQFACMTEWLSDKSSSYITEEFSWNVALSDAGSRPRRASTLGDGAHMRSSIESTLVSPNSSRGPSNRARRELIANTVLPSLSSMIKRMDQVVENTLLDSARAASTGPS